ncbi:DUF523 domain-containing protein [Halobacteriovorax sp. GB3]|uniref:DUF523 domain-containing protein n=1 Tax=Halobacteriovorax sp. GB3 TaxID=2719615 RepID=UPI00235FEE3D|nr:DUF523 domain-containing protein [Halobacteriovorax sp. GB3]MDD0853341.1 DUF523 domain-containing protein [Halobacteriovorax sp. GB3]
MEKETKYIVSACLAGLECRYDCQSKERQFVVELVQKGLATPVCPEQLGGLSTPRDPAEIVNGKVLSIKGKDVTFEYEKGASEALKIAKLTGATKALLKSKSPMCGHGEIYDGTYSGQTIKGEGVLSTLLLKNNIEIESVE